MTAPTIVVHQATLTYQHRVVFSELDFTLPAGKWVALLGPSGIGKTSLLRLIADLQTKHADIVGKVTADNHLPVSDQIAYMAQTDLLMPWLTTLENTCLGLKLRRQSSKLNHSAKQKMVSDKREKAINLLERAGLKDALSLYPHQLSGGMRQRVALVRTMLEDKPIILMDEPFSALDAITRHELQALAVELFKDRTVLFITHDPAEAGRLAHQIYMMEGKPATLRKVSELTTQIPRQLNDPIVIALQTQLLQTLTVSTKSLA